MEDRTKTDGGRTRQQWWRMKRTKCPTVLQSRMERFLSAKTGSLVLRVGGRECAKTGSQVLRVGGGEGPKCECVCNGHLDVLNVSHGYVSTTPNCRDVRTTPLKYRQKSNVMYEFASPRLLGSGGNQNHVLASCVHFAHVGTFTCGTPQTSEEKQQIASQTHQTHNTMHGSNSNYVAYAHHRFQFPTLRPTLMKNNVPRAYVLNRVQDVIT